MPNTTKPLVAYACGDGIGPEIMESTLSILKAAKAPLEYIPVQIGEKLYLSGETTGISKESWDILKRADAFLKAPITTPQGGGFKSLNVTIRTAFGLFAAIRPALSYSPFIATKHPKMDLVIIRENEEDLYTGMEYRQTEKSTKALKIITEEGSRRIIRFGFDYARKNGRKKVSCFTKNNILKLTDGLFAKLFEEIGAEYEEIEREHWIVDIGAAKLAAKPEMFDVLVLPNLYGDILSDVAAEISGSVGLAPSANIGENKAMFEAIHGSAPKRAGQDVANPSGLLLASCMMLSYLNLSSIGALIQNAWLKTIEDGLHTYDIYREGTSKLLVGTKAFTQAVIERLGQEPRQLKGTAAFGALSTKGVTHDAKSKDICKKTTRESKRVVGADIFIYEPSSIDHLLPLLLKLPNPLKLKRISNRGTVIYPKTLEEHFCSDTWGCRFLIDEAEHDQIALTLHEEVAKLLLELSRLSIEWLHVELLYLFDGKQGF